MSWKLTKSKSGPSHCIDALLAPPVMVGQYEGNVAASFDEPSTSISPPKIDADKSLPLELKETHLGPLANTFSRSTSTSTITGDTAKDEKASIASSTPTNDNGIGTSDTMQE